MKKITLEALTACLTQSVAKTIAKLTGKQLNISSSVKTKTIVTWCNKMRIFGSEKFDKEGAVSFVKLYTDEGAKNKDKPYAVVISYMERERVSTMAEILGVHIELKDRPAAEDFEKQNQLVKDYSGQLVKALADGIKTELAGIGYPELIPSVAENHVKSVPYEIAYPTKVDIKYELCAKVEGAGTFFVDLVIPVS